MADSTDNAKKRKPYQAPKLETVEVVAEEALLAICAFAGGTQTNITQGAPCSACFS